MDLTAEFIDGFDSTVLIVADRLYEYGVGIAYYMKQRTNGRVLGVIEKYEQALPFLSQDMDFVIYCGYQQNEKNYSIIQDVRSGNSPPPIVMCATFDSLLLGICMENNIEYQYDKSKPISGLIHYLNTIKKEKSLLAQC